MKKYILYGAGLYGKRALHFFCAENVYCFVYKLFGRVVEGIKVISIEELIRLGNKEEYIVVITPTKIEVVLEIATTLIENKIDYQLFQEAATKYIDKDKDKYSELNKRKTFDIEEKTLFYCSMDRNDDAGSVDQYLWQDLWAAKYVLSDRPPVHYDIGSRIDGFITHLLAAKQKVITIDVRPLQFQEENIGFIQGDATNLNMIDDLSIDSISALCSLEHFGLGRYGDPIDPEACFNCFDAIQNKLRKDGKIYIAVPVGREHVEFNAHRVFKASTIIGCFNRCKLVEYSVAHEKEIEYNVGIDKYDNEPYSGAGAFGLFYFQKC